MIQKLYLYTKKKMLFMYIVRIIYEACQIEFAKKSEHNTQGTRELMTMQKIITLNCTHCWVYQTPIANNNKLRVCVIKANISARAPIINDYHNYFDCRRKCYLRSFLYSFEDVLFVSYFVYNFTIFS